MQTAIDIDIEKEEARIEERREGWRDERNSST